MPSFIWASVGGLAYMPAAISAVASFTVSSLIVLVSCRQVRHHSAGRALTALPPLRSVGGAVTGALRVVQHPRQLVHIDGLEGVAGDGDQHPPNPALRHARVLL